MKTDMPRNSPSALCASIDQGTALIAAMGDTGNGLRTLHSQHLFGVSNEVLIEHAGSTYRLRITQANKLILTK
jgi:hemin uptake protein HemP